MKLTKTKQKQLDEAYDILIQVCLYDRPLQDMEPYLANDVMNFGAGKKEITKTKATFLKQIKNQKKLAAGLKMDFNIKPVLRKIINQGTGAIYTDDIVNTVWINGVKNKLKFRLSFIFEYRQHKWIMVHSHTSTPDPQRADDEVWPVEELKKRTAVLEKSLDEKIAELENKNRELEIETALERVRAVAMSMRKPEDLTAVGENIFTELKGLGFTDLRNTEIIIINDAIETLTSYYYSDYGVTGVVEVLYKTNPTVKKWVKDLKKANDAFAEVVIHENEMAAWRKYREEVGHLPDPKLNEAKTVYYYSYSIGMGGLSISTFKPASGEQIKILERFRNVFNLSYQRYTDIALAEAQARESQIELALERVRARTMAMQRSDELAETASLLFKQINELGIRPWTSGFNIWEENDTSFIGYNPTPSGDITAPYHIPSTENSFFKNIYEAKKRGEDFFVFESAGESLAATYDYMKTLPVVKEVLKGIEDAGFKLPTFQINHCAFFSHGFLLFITLEPHTEAHDIFKRFAKVFEQTYTRFLDLQKAEAQTREAKIEAALEKVRSRTMAMQRSEELAEVATVLFQQVKAFGVPQWTCGFSIWEIGDKEFTWYPGSPDGDILPPCQIPLMEHPVFISFDESRKRGDELFVYEKEGEFQADHYRYMQSLPGLRELMQNMLDAGLQIPTFQIDHIANFSHGNLVFITYEHFPEMHDIFKRFAKVFDQTYTRFLDLQKAEVQAREAKIEAALEKVRSRTMAMYKSDELNEANTTIIQQIKSLEVRLYAFGIHICHLNEPISEAWMGDPIGGYMPKVIYDHSQDPLSIRMYSGWKEGKTLIVEKLEGEALKEHFEYMITLVPDRSIFDNLVAPESLVFHFAYFTYGFFVFLTQEHCPEEHSFFKRLAKVFEQTYTRFLDLQKAEAQAREVVKQASVDRVRAEIASMRTTSDLERITPLVWSELKTLAVPFIRCGVFIIDEEQQQVHTFLSTPDGKANASFTSAFSTVSIITEALPYWRRKEMYKAHWDEATFLEQTKQLVERGAVSATNTYLTENRPKNLYLHFLPFLQGILYVGNETPLNDEELKLVQNLADAFSIAYARYEDFNKLELAKEQIEKTLVDLKQAQAQLVQSEKMASLGELTAGIAHEIQNPLNFVNNFSEVNKELLAEMKEEMDKGNMGDAKEIADDVIDNEEKINHHGKRADAIVKGMLQHSRSSSGVKEPTDINVLADEYLRLAYHGLRAKDKSFNATMKSDFDESIGNINIIRQDIGRVVLNLINNAFYAVSERKKQQPDGYEPTVSVSTKRVNDKVEIRVKDNGNGIPEKVLDKIFQPFFTTKPTGQGTGLGLSLAYDIVKAHGGELKVATKEKEGTEFIIILPA